MLNQNWPLYSDGSGNYITALPIKAVTQSQDGSGVVSFNGNYPDQYVSAHFIAVFRPVATGYLFRSQYGEVLYLAKAAFEAKYTKDNTDGYTLPKATGSVLGGVTIGTGLAISGSGELSLPLATTTVRGGITKGAAVANSAATDVAGVNTVLNALLVALRTSGVIST